MKKIILFLLTIILCLLPFYATRAAIAITPPNYFMGDGTLDRGTSSSISVNIIDEYPGDYYLKAYFYPPDNAKARFGYVWNSTTNKWVSAWQPNSTQLQINVIENQNWNGVPVKGLWQGEISVKTDIEKLGYTGPGDYTLKVKATSVSTGHTIEISTKTSIMKPDAGSQAPPQNLQQSNQQTNQTTNPNSQTTTPQTNMPESQNSQPTLTPTPAVIYPLGVVINEILPNPEGADETEEWIEIFNQNSFEVDLSGWKIQDIKGSITTYVFSKNTKISGRRYLVLKRPETKITLNNTEDGLNLLDPNQKIVDSLNYNTAPRNQSYNKTGNNWAWSDILTPGSLNNISENQNLPAVKDLPNSKKSDISNKIDKKIETAGTAAISQNTSPWFLFLIALIITIVSAIIILILKIRFKKPIT